MYAKDYYIKEVIEEGKILKVYRWVLMLGQQKDLEVDFEQD